MLSSIRSIVKHVHCQCFRSFIDFKYKKCPKSLYAFDFFHGINLKQHTYKMRFSVK